MVDEMLSFEAKVSVGGSEGGCGGFAARVEAGGREANRLVVFRGELDVENGFALLEHGEVGVAPKSAVPRS